jgi:hypothetical protein
MEESKKEPSCAVPEAFATDGDEEEFVFIFVLFFFWGRG